jgi:hypothetical protein
MACIREKEIRKTLCVFKNLGYLGLEPRTYRLKAEYSTIELVTLKKKMFKNVGSAYVQEMKKKRWSKKRYTQFFFFSTFRERLGVWGHQKHTTLTLCQTSKNRQLWGFVGNRECTDKKNELRRKKKICGLFNFEKTTEKTWLKISTTSR